MAGHLCGGLRLAGRRREHRLGLRVPASGGIRLDGQRGALPQHPRSVLPGCRHGGGPIPRWWRYLDGRLRSADATDAAIPELGTGRRLPVPGRAQDHLIVSAERAASRCAARLLNGAEEPNYAIRWPLSSRPPGPLRLLAVGITLATAEFLAEAAAGGVRSSALLQ
jgi:hypothetical protein